MGILLDGIYVLKLYKEGFVILFVSALGIGGWGIRFFQLDDQRYVVPKLSFALSFGTLFLILPAFVLVLLGRIWYPILKYGSLLIPIIGLIMLVDWIRRDRFMIKGPDLIFFCSFLVVTLLVRLAFLKGIVLPPYNDSPEHYMIVQNLVAPEENASAFYSIDTIASRYYHFGFHFLAAWITAASNLDEVDSIALLGQLSLVILPISVFLLVYSTTHNSIAGFVAMLFSAFAWRMPAFASNWGKYPALAGSSLLPAVIALWILYWHTPHKKIITSVALIIASVGLIFVHTRLAICQALVLISLLLSQRLPYFAEMNYRKACLFALLSITAFLPLWEYFMVYYDNGLYLAFVLIALLLPFAIYFYPRLSISIILFTVGIWIVSHVLVFLENYETALLDRPFIEILLSIPISMLGGIGFAGLFEQLQRPALRRFAILMVLVVITVSFVAADAVYPDPCCNYVRPSDFEAIQWLAGNTPSTGVIWIAALKRSNYMVATDAGVWVHALTGRNANKLNIDFEWSSIDSLTRICGPGYEDVYIYKGSGPYSFEDNMLAEEDWLEPVFTSGETKIYKVKVTCALQLLD